MKNQNSTLAQTSSSKRKKKRKPKEELVWVLSKEFTTPVAFCNTKTDLTARKQKYRIRESRSAGNKSRSRERDKRACKGSAAAMAGSSAKPKQGLRGKFNFRFHTCSRLVHSLVCFILCGIVNPMAIFFWFFVLSVFLRKGECGKSSLGRKLLICIFTHGSSLSGFIILCGASNPMAMVVVFVLLFFLFFSFLQIGVSRPL